MTFNLNRTSPHHLIALVLLCVLFGVGLPGRLLNLSYFLLIIVALVALFRKTGITTQFGEVYQSFKLLHWAMGSMLVALILSQIAHGHLYLPSFNSIARLATFVVVLWLGLNLKIEQLRTVQWAWVAGIVLCAVQIWFLPRGYNGRPEIENWHVALASLLGTFSVFSLAWDEKPSKLSIAIHLLGGLCGIYVIYVSQTRGVWIALPIFIILGYAAFVPKAFALKKIGYLLAAVAIVGVLFFSTDLAKSRIEQAAQDIQIYAVDKNTDTSVGVRFQLWEAGWKMIEEHPFIGVGTGDYYKEALKEMASRRVLPTDYNGAHSHNELIYSTATMGVLGLIAILMTYLVPAYYFSKSLFNQDRQIRAAAAMGLSVCAGFMIFGLVDVLFQYKECETFYCVACAVFFAFIGERKKQLQPDSRSICNNP